MAHHANSPPPSKRSRQHSKRIALSPRQSTSCTLYTSPVSTTTLPVFEAISITWDPKCLTLSTSTIDLYLNVVQDTAIVAVHVWTGITYSSGKLDTQFNPTWWNASTGAGTVEGQLAITASGAPSWETTAPSGPTFSIAYNGTYPTVTTDANPPVYTGPSVESVSSPSSSISGGKLGAAVAVPLLVVLAGVLAYVAWNRWKKRPEKKRWSAVIDKRMSMISQGTCPPPRPSTSSRPGSHYSTHSRGGSVYSGMAPGPRPGSVYSHRPSASISRSPLSNSMDGRPASTFSSPLAMSGGSQRPSASVRSYSHEGRPQSGYSSTGGPRPPPPAEMRQIGSGDRVSRVSFAGTESSRRAANHGHSSSVASRGARTSTYSVGSFSLDSPAPPLPRAGSTREDLAPAAIAAYHAGNTSNNKSTQPRNPSHLARGSTSSLQEADFPALAVIRDPSMTFPTTSPEPNTLAFPGPPSPALSIASSTKSSSFSPFADPSPDVTRPLPTRSSSIKKPKSHTALPPITTSHMPMANRSSILSPDELLTRYAVKREASTRAVPTLASGGAAAESSKEGAGAGTKWGGLLTGWKKNKQGSSQSVQQVAQPEPVKVEVEADEKDPFDAAEEEEEETTSSYGHAM